MLGLGERGERTGPVAPGQAATTAKFPGAGGLLGQDGAVPGERGLLGRGAGRVETLLGDAAAQGIVAVAPGAAVRGGDGGQPVVRIPPVGPGSGRMREPRPVPADDAALPVVPVADGPGTNDERAGALARALQIG